MISSCATFSLRGMQALNSPQGSARAPVLHNRSSHHVHHRARHSPTGALAEGHENLWAILRHQARDTASTQAHQQLGLSEHWSRVTLRGVAVQPIMHDLRKEDTSTGANMLHVVAGHDNPLSSLQWGVFNYACRCCRRRSILLLRLHRPTIIVSRSRLSLPYTIRLYRDQILDLAKQPI